MQGRDIDGHLGKRPCSRGHVHSVAVDVPLPEKHVAQVDPDPELQPAPIGGGRDSDLVLHGERAVHGIKGALKGGDQLVAGVGSL